MDATHHARRVGGRVIWGEGLARGVLIERPRLKALKGEPKREMPKSEL